MKPALPPWLVVVLLACGVVSGCSHRAPLPGRREYLTPLPTANAVTPTAAANVAPGNSPSQGSKTEDNFNATSPRTASAWRQAAVPWLGTPYRIGGLSRDGIDCSGFSQTLHREVAQRKLARTSQAQWNNSVPVSPNQVQPGDLVFFNTTGKGVSHVGVFLAGQEFVHASTSKGVIYSQLTDPYWSTRYLGARRPR